MGCFFIAFPFASSFYFLFQFTILQLAPLVHIDIPITLLIHVRRGV